MAEVFLGFAVRDQQWFDDNPTHVLRAGSTGDGEEYAEIVFHKTTGRYKKGDNVTPISSLPWMPIGDTRILFKSVGDPASVSGSEAILIAAKIPANTLKVGDILTVRSLTLKTGTSNVGGIRYRVNNTPGLSGSTEIARLSGANGTIMYLPISRRLIVKNNATIDTLIVTSNTVNDESAVSATLPTSVSVDITQDIYIILTGLTTAALDSVSASYFIITCE